MLKRAYLLAVDYGGTNSKCCIFDLEGNLVSKSVLENTCYSISQEMLEWHGEEMIDTLYKVVKEAISHCNISAKEIIGVCFTMCRCTMVMRDENGGFTSPVFLVPDMRGSEMLPWMKQKLAEAGLTENDLYDRTGLPLGPSYPSAKLYWVMKHNPEVYEKTQKIHTIMGLMTKAFGAEDYFDDKNDVPWMQLNNRNFEYDKELCSVFGVDMNKLAPLRETGEIIGYVTKEVSEKTGLVEGTPLIMGTGDQQSGGIGAGCIYEGLGYVGLGTGGNAATKSKKVIRDPNRKCQILGAPDSTSVIEGQANISGRAFKWLMQILCEKESMLASLTDFTVYDLMTKEAERSSIGANGCIFLPYLQGANTPMYNGDAKGAFIGMTLFHNKSDLIRAVMEGIAFETKDMICAIENSGVKNFSTVRVTGGVANSEFWNQIQADVYDKVVETVAVDEVPALGAAIIASVGLNVYSSYQDAVEHMVKVNKRYFPNKENVKKYKKIYKIWKDAYSNLSQGTFEQLTNIQRVIQDME